MPNSDNNQPETVSCPFCGEPEMTKAGTYYNTRELRQRWQCPGCHRYPSTLIHVLPERDLEQVE